MHQTHNTQHPPTKRYTFPAEQSLGHDALRAACVYERCVGRTLTCGTTTALYFGTLDLAPTVALAQTMVRASLEEF